MIYNKYVIGDPHMGPIIKPTVEDSPWYIMKIDEIHNTLDSMKTLKKGWDSYNANPIPISAIIRAKSVLEYGLKFGLYPLSISPSVVGGVGLLYQSKATTSNVYVEFKEHSIHLADLETSKVENLTPAQGLLDLENITENILKYVDAQIFQNQLIIILSNPPFSTDCSNEELFNSRSTYMSKAETKYGVEKSLIRLIDESPWRYPMFIDNYYLCHDLVKYKNIVDCRLNIGCLVLHSSTEVGTQQVDARENLVNCNSMVSKGKLIPLIGTSFSYPVEKGYNEGQMFDF